MRDAKRWTGDEETSETGPLGVVVGVDGSQAALRAVRWAAAEARVRALPLHVLHAAPYAAGPAAGPGLQRAEEVLAAAVTVARRAAPQTWVTSHCSHEPAVPALRAATQRAWLLVLGGTDRPRAEPTESVGLRVVEDASCPVVVVRGRLRLAADDRPVVVGVDTPDVDADAVAAAITDAGRHRCPLVVVHAGHGDPHDDTELGRLVDQLTKHHPDVPTLLEVSTNHPTTALLDAARTARLLVIGSRGRSAPVRVLLGSTCRDLLRRSPVPVEVVTNTITRPPPESVPAFSPLAGDPHDRSQLW